MLKTTRRLWLSLLSLFLLVLLASGCSQPTPEERVAELRAGYTATLNGFVVVQEPMPMAEEVTEEGEPMAADDASDEGEEAAEEVIELPLNQDVKLDIVVNNDNYDKLPGITMDVSQADGTGTEKNHWRVYIDTSGITRGSRSAIVHTLEDVDHQEGDGYFVEIRTPIPAEEQAEYQEFSEAS